MKTKLFIFKPGGKIPEEKTIDMSETPSYTEIADIMIPILANDCSDVEHVSVLYNNRQHDMFVDGEGAINKPYRRPLPHNEEATKIYYEADRQRGSDVTMPQPGIHGIAIITDRLIWR